MPDPSRSALCIPLLDIRLGRFAIAGLANTCVGLFVIFACKGFMGMGDAASNLVGYAIAALLGFLAHKHWTFEHSGASASAFLRYLLVLSLAYAANLATTLWAIELMNVNSYLAQAAGVVPYAAVGYLGGRFFAFRSARLPG